MPSTSKRAPNIDSLGIGSNLQHIMRDMHNRIHQDSMLLSLFKKTFSSASSKTMMMMRSIILRIIFLGATITTVRIMGTIVIISSI